MFTENTFLGGLLDVLLSERDHVYIYAPVQV